MPKRYTVLVDLDSTLCDTTHRHKLINGDDTDWVAYSMACGDDKPIQAVQTLIYLLAEHYKIVFVSGRCEEAKPQTIKWLAKHQIPRDGLLMRPEGNRDTNSALKLSLIKQLVSEGHKIALAIDDYIKVKHMYDECGIPVLIVNPCYEMPEPEQEGIFYESLR